MNKILYSDLQGSYSLLDYNRSHSELLIRKRTINHANVDIIFKSVQLIFIPTALIGIEIILLNDATEILRLKEKYHLTTDYGYRIYIIKNIGGNEFYLNAGVFGVFNNDLDILVSSLGDFTWSSSNKLIYWSE